MPVRSIRRFTVSDAMITVAAMATALAAMRSVWPSDPSLLNSARPALYSNLLLDINRNVSGFSLMAASLTVACLVMRLRRPRRPLRSLASQPGAVACSAAVTVLAIGVVNLGGMVGVLTLDGIYPAAGLGILDLSDAQLRGLPSEAGCAVAAVWVILVASRRWHCEPSWIDRMGRILGVFWVGTIPFAWFTTHYN